MTGNEALTYLRKRRAFLGEAARAARVIGLDAGYLDEEAEALSWAIRIIESASAAIAAPYRPDADHPLDRLASEGWPT